LPCSSVAPGSAPACASGVGSYEVREYGVAGISCPDGTGGDWDFSDGSPQPGSSSGFDMKLGYANAVLSWDGFLLVGPVILQ